MKELNYVTEGTCSKLIHIELDDNNIIQDVQFVGGCNGNLKGICSLIKGQKATDVIARTQGISCNGRPTSCPDQLSRALKQMVEGM